MRKNISVKNLNKKYKTKETYSLKDFSFSVEEGEIIGILGPNGAGKSTLIKMLLGIMKPTSGEIQVLGRDPLKFRKKEKMQIGVLLGGKSNLVFHLSAIESVRLFGTIYKVSPERFEKNLREYAAILQCEEFLDQRVATLSLGQKLRIELLCILIYEPKLLILDEPTLGLDIEGKRKFREVLYQMVKEKNISVLITTHDVNDMEKFATRIIMVHQGEKVIDFSNHEYNSLLEKYVVMACDCELDGEVEGVRFLEKNQEEYRYLVEKESVHRVKENLFDREYLFLKQELPRREDESQYSEHNRK